MKVKKWISSLIIVALLALASYWFEQNGEPTDPSSPSDSSVVQLTFPSDRYPETAKHIQDAIAKGESATCTINREQAEENRKESLKGIPTKRGMTGMNGQWLCVRKAALVPTLNT